MVSQALHRKHWVPFAGVTEMIAAVADVMERQTPGEFGGPDPAAERGALARRAMAALGYMLATLLLLWPAFWNGYPLVFADSGTYLGQALLHYLGWDRPPFYSFFLLLSHWRMTLWLPVLTQGLLMAHLLGLCLRALGRTEIWALPITAAALALLTPLPWFVAQLMPDFFTGVTVLTLWLLGFRLSTLSIGERIYVLGLAMFAVAVHQSHLPLALALTGVAWLLISLRRGWRHAWRPALRMLVPALVTAAALTGVNGIGRGQPSLSPFGMVFLAARVIYDGPGMAVARRECPEVGWKLCEVLDRMPPGHNSFLWNADSPLQDSLGGAQVWATEARQIVFATLRAEPGAMAVAALGNTLMQLGLFGVGDGLEPWPPPHGPQPLVARFFPGELPALQDGRQQTGRLVVDARRFIPLHLAAVLAGGIGLLGLLIFRWQRLPAPAAGLAVMMLAAVVVNAGVAGALSGPAGRYQARIIWLVPFVSGVLLAGLRLVPQPAPASLRPRFPS